MAVQVIIADGNHIIRCGLSTIFSNYEQIQVAAQVENQDELLDSVKNFSPTVVLIDYLSNGFTIDSIAALKREFPLQRIVAITPEQSAVTIVNALRAGVDSYIKKDCDVSEIVDSVIETGNGSTFFCGKILESIRKESIDVDDLDINEFSCEPVSLSARELEVITLIAEGHTNNQIAEKLFLSAHTVNTHRKNIMQKLGVNNTAAIVMYAVKAQLVSPNKFLFSPFNS